MVGFDCGFVLIDFVLGLVLLIVVHLWFACLVVCVTMVAFALVVLGLIFTSCVISLLVVWLIILGFV